MYIRHRRSRSPPLWDDIDLMFLISRRTKTDLSYSSHRSQEHTLDLEGWEKNSVDCNLLYLWWSVWCQWSFTCLSFSLCTNGLYDRRTSAERFVGFLCFFREQLTFAVVCNAVLLKLDSFCGFRGSKACFLELSQRRGPRDKSSVWTWPTRALPADLSAGSALVLHVTLKF